MADFSETTLRAKPRTWGTPTRRLRQGTINLLLTRGGPARPPEPPPSPLPQGVIPLELQVQGVIPLELQVQGVIPLELQVQGVIPLELQVQGVIPLELQVQAVIPLELQVQGDTLLDPPGRGPRGSSHISLVAPEHQGSTRDPLLPLEASTPGLGSPDSTPLHLELQDSSLLALEPRASFPGSSPLSTPGIIPLKELQDSSPEALPLTQPDPFPLDPEPPLVHIKICRLILDVSPEETGCTGRGVRVHSPPQPALELSQDSLLEASLPCPPGPGAPPQPEDTLRPPAPSAPAPDPWVHTGVHPLQEACPDIIHRIIESNELKFSVGHGLHLQNQRNMMPYDLPLHSGILPQLVITIEAEPVPGAERFQVDFIKGSDVVFHFNPRFSEQTIVRNSNLGGVGARRSGTDTSPSDRAAASRVGGMEEVTLLRVQGDMVLYSVAPNMI
ncbi:hypothetical protein F7725_008424 [Dissostichus mawsoni]|uniref:Galectin n=1 Tax=Dissostichus mawsoni TaxID=36200 RepID=A0A7J5Y8F8_DISMA|nr:hypothetical protein F7725_008424 [Dissostichus mawsoni]